VVAAMLQLRNEQETAARHSVWPSHLVPIRAPTLF
jgi:hypothetical protein